MKRMGLFWKLYMLFFAIPFPMILYYSISGSQQPAHTGPLLVKFYLALSVVLWAITLFLLFKSWILGVFEMHNTIKKLTTQGILIPATVTDSVSTGPSKSKDAEPLEVTLAFANLAGEMVSERMEINDSRPYEHRYEIGKTVNLRLDPDLKPPCLMPEDTRVYLKKNVLVLRVLGLLLLLAVITGYYIFSYNCEGQGRSWDFMVFWHPLVLCPLIMFFPNLFTLLLLRKFFGPGKDDLRLKFYGKKTLAKLRNAKETGLRINDQPQVLFEMEYSDDLGKKYQVKLKKIVSLLNLGIAREKEIEIFYLPEDPHTIAFARDLE